MLHLKSYGRSGPAAQEHVHTWDVQMQHMAQRQMQALMARQMAAQQAAMQEQLHAAQAAAQAAQAEAAVYQRTAAQVLGLIGSPLLLSKPCPPPARR